MSKASVFLRFLGALTVGVAVLLVVVLRVTSCAPRKPLEQSSVSSPTRTAPPDTSRADCRALGWTEAAAFNAGSLHTLVWAPFGRQEAGWETYVPLVQHEIGTSCPPGSEGFAAALAAWAGQQRLPTDGVMSEVLFSAVRGAVQNRRDFVRLAAGGVCPDASYDIAAARIEEGYAGKQIHLRPAALRAYRQMVTAAKAEVPAIAADPRNLTVFSGYRSPALDAQRCATEGNCDGVVRARCSAHRTGLALDIYVGQAPGFGPDSTADPNRLFMSRTATYGWLVKNAGRFGFVNYPFEPWHWEWTGEPP